VGLRAPNTKLTAVVLRTVDYGESDRVVTLLSRERGKVSAFARGARASRKRFGGSLEPFTLLAAEVRARASSDLLGLESTSVVRGYGGIRGDLARIACAAYAAELARELVRDHEPHEDLFQLLIAYLEALDGAPARPATLRAFELGALGAAGLAPRLDACARCGDPFAPAARGFRFDPGQGGVLCGACSATAPGAPHVSRAGYEAMARLQAGGLGAAAAEPLPPPVGRELREALGAFIVHHLGRTLAARRFLDEVGPVLDPSTGSG
jgi:DNA repair protein RecO (recombination protein O)